MDLFSGIGGFALAAGWTGWETIGFSETDEYCCKILKKHWPGVRNYGDIRTMRGVSCDLVTGGFPCQPYSLAGKRGGAGDDRALWPEMLRVIAESKPRWVLGENVPGIINMELDRVLSDLENIGYSAWPVVLPACAVDARHRRSRVWIVGWNSDAMRCSRNGGPKRTVQNENHDPNGICKDVADRISEGLEEWKEQSARQERETTKRNGNSLADTDGNQQRRRACPEQVRRERSTSEDGENGIERGTEWPTEPAIRRVAHGIPHRVDRLRGLGNAIVPQVAAVILAAMD